jgi:multiple sugar transport system ATP-binding protein
MNFISGTILQNGSMKFMQDRSNFSLPVPREMESRLATHVKLPITVGIRPEHIYEKRPAGADTFASFKANVEVVEPVGNEIFVYFSTGTDSQYVARIASDTPPEVGKPYDLFFDTSKIHFFDKETGQAI